MSTSGGGGEYIAARWIASLFDGYGLVVQRCRRWNVPGMMSSLEWLALITGARLGLLTHALPSFEFEQRVGERTMSRGGGFSSFNDFIDEGQHLFLGN